MIKKWKKGLVRSFVTMFSLAVLLSACNTDGTGNEQTEGSDTPDQVESTDVVGVDPNVDPAYAPLKDKVTLTIGRGEDANASYLPGENSADNYIVRYIQDQLNVEYEQAFSVDGSTYETKVGMAITTDDIPDVMVVTESQLRQLAQGDAVADLTDAYEKYASDNLKAAYDTTDGISFTAATFSDRLMALPNIRPRADGIPILFVRGDWMEELNIDEPKSLDDIINIAKTFMEENPGGNVTDGITVHQNVASASGNTYGLDAVFGLYDAYPKMWLDDGADGLIYGSITENAKNALGAIRNMVEEGVINPSFVVRDSDQAAEIITSGQSGMFFGAWWNRSYPLIDMSKDDESITWNTYLAPLTDDGVYNTHMMSPSANYLVVKEGSSEEVLEAVIKTANYQFDIDQDQGVSIKPSVDAPYSWTSMPFSLLLSRYDDKEMKAQAVRDVVDGKLEENELIGEQVIWYDSYKDVLDNGIASAIANNNASGFGFTEGAYVISSNDDIINKVYAKTYSRSESMDRKWATLEKLEDETYLRILSGEAALDEFDDFVTQWEELGGTDITKELLEMISN